jgi:hypothetical protein
MKYQEATLPNWCGGVVTVSGKPENVKEFCKLFLFEEDTDNEDIDKKYFARSFINSKWKDFEEEHFKDNPNEVQFVVDFAWSCWSCLIEGYPQEDRKHCITLKNACKKYDVKVEISSEEPGMCFEEEIKADKKGVNYSSKEMIIYECICGVSQPVSSDADFKDVECYSCGEVGKFQCDLLKRV